MGNLLKIIIFISFLNWDISMGYFEDESVLVVPAGLKYRSFAFPDRKLIRPTEKLERILAS